MKRIQLGLRWATIVIATVAVIGLLNSIHAAEPTGQQASSPMIRSADLVQDLVYAGWEAKAAEAVVRINAQWFEIAAQVNPAELPRQMTLLKALGKHKHLASLLQQHPETASLLAGVDDPTLLAESLTSAREHYGWVSGLYVLHAQPEEAVALAQALERNRNLIYDLSERGVVGSEVLFIFNRDKGDAALEYERWLQEVLSSKLHGTEEELASIVHFLLEQGPEIRERLRDNDAFKTTFRSDIWPKLARVAAGQYHPLCEEYLADPTSTLEVYIDRPQVWDLLLLQDGEKLLQDWGPLPIDLLYGAPEAGQQPYPKDVHAVVMRILLKQDCDALYALMTFRHDARFYELLRRPVSWDTQRRAFRKLREARSEYGALLDTYNRLNDGALRDEVGPESSGPQTLIPGYYSLYAAPKKLLQGRDLTTFEYLAVIGDLASIIPPIKGAWIAGKSMVPMARGPAALGLLKGVGTDVAKDRLGKAVMGQVSERTLVRFGVTDRLLQMRTLFRTAVRQSPTVEITHPVRFMLGYSGVGQKTLQHLNKLEAQVLLRDEAKVAISFGNDAAGKLIRQFMNETAQNGVLVSAPVQDMLKKGLQTAIEREESWRKHIAAWWLMHASGLLDTTIAEVAK